MDMETPNDSKVCNPLDTNSMDPKSIDSKSIDKSSISLSNSQQPISPNNNYCFLKQSSLLSNMYQSVTNIFPKCNKNICDISNINSENELNSCVTGNNINVIDNDCDSYTLLNGLCNINNTKSCSISLPSSNSSDLISPSQPHYMRLNSSSSNYDIFRSSNTLSSSIGSFNTLISTSSTSTSNSTLSNSSIVLLSQKLQPYLPKFKSLSMISSSQFLCNTFTPHSNSNENYYSYPSEITTSEHVPCKTESFIIPGDSRYNNVNLTTELDNNNFNCPTTKFHEKETSYLSSIERYKSLDRDWNFEFQALCESVTDEAILSEETYFRRLSQLSSDFVHTACLFGEIIISELYMSNDRKTIKPKELGGFLGGEKYECNNIVFKFAVDDKRFFNSDEVSMRSANHELLGVTEMAKFQDIGLCCPLMTVIDWRGYRLIAMSKLPITKESIVYGSFDGGKTIHHSNKLVNEKIEKAGAALNLKPHLVLDKSGNEHLISLPFDMEVHQGLDDRTYMLDFSRLFPPLPEFVNRNFRPEFLRKYKIKLSPDSGLRCEVQNCWNDNVDAYNHLITIIIPEFSTEIETKPLPKNSSDLNTFISLLHHKGINVCLLPILWKFTNLWRPYIQVELLARTFKNMLRLELRTATISRPMSLDITHRVVIAFINKYFCKNADWSELSQELNQRFNDIPFEIKLFTIPQLFMLLFNRFIDISSIVLNHLDTITSSEISTFIPMLDETQISVIVKAKHTNFVYYAQGTALFIKALTANNEFSDEKESLRIGLLAKEKFDNALLFNRSDFATWCNYGFLESIIFKNNEAAKKCYEHALETWYYRAILFRDEQELNEADKSFKNAIAHSNRTHINSMKDYGNFLRYNMKHLKGSFESAKEMYSACLKFDPNHVKSNYYLATLLLEKPSSVNDFEIIFNSLRVASNKIFSDGDKNIQAKLKARKKFLELLPVRTDVLISFASNNTTILELSKLYDELYVELSDYPLFLFYYAHFYSVVVRKLNSMQVLSYYKDAANYFLNSMEIAVETDFPILRNKSSLYSERRRRTESTIDYTYLFNYIDLLLSSSKFDDVNVFLYRFELVSNNSRLSYVGFAKVYMHSNDLIVAEMYLLKSVKDLSFSFLISYLPKDFKYPVPLNDSSLLSKEFIRWTESDFKVNFDINRHNIIVAVETFITYFHIVGANYYEFLFRAICIELRKSVCRSIIPCIHSKYNMFCYCYVCKRTEMVKFYNKKSIYNPSVSSTYAEIIPTESKQNEQISRPNDYKINFNKVTPPKVVYFPEIERNSSEETELELDKLLVNQDINFDFEGLL